MPISWTFLVSSPESFSCTGVVVASSKLVRGVVVASSKLVRGLSDGLDGGLSFSELNDVDVSSSEARSKYRHTTAQSSTLDVGYLRRHTRTADSTRNRAAVARVGAVATICTASSLLNTSQICNH